MDAKGKRRTIRGRVALGLALACALPAASETSEASPVRWGGSHRVAAQGLARSGGGSDWGSFLAGGEPTWASQQAPTFTLPVRQAILRLIGGDPSLAASSPLISYLIWRRNLDVARFDFYHPFVGPRLPQGLVPPVRQVVPPLAPPTNIPTPPVVPPPDPPAPSVVPPVVPEPSAFVVITLGAAGALWMRRRRESAS